MRARRPTAPHKRNGSQRGTGIRRGVVAKPRRGGFRQEVAGDGRRDRGSKIACRLHVGHLQDADGLAFQARLAGLAMVGRYAHVVAAVLVHVDHLRHACCLHRARLRGRLHPRHPAKGKREANQQEQTQPQVAFHAGQSSRWQLAAQLPLCKETYCLYMYAIAEQAFLNGQLCTSTEAAGSATTGVWGRPGSS